MSRRLGISLGVDLVPPKTCPFECVYCEAGKTTNKTVSRREFYPLSDILKELDSFLSSKPTLDYITFSGAGEPTLYSRLGELIKHIKEKFPDYKVCLITNAILIGQGNMPEELRGIDLIIPSLDASDEDTFKKINRPVPEITLESLLESIKTFRRKNPAKMWLEIFIIPGLNDSESSIAKFAKMVADISPDKVQLNGIDRPGIEKWIEKPQTDTLAKFHGAISPFCEVQNIVRHAPHTSSSSKNRLEILDSILATLSRRPCTEEELAKMFSLKEGELEKSISESLSSGILKKEKTENGIFLVIGKK
ncbi:MAG TPA: radical SAM protein [Victivallales bacterium]|nr:radical SAM protein [Victivallales bacterium]